ncbi:MAG: diaminopimelate decarboxylase [Candidatus Omnitrophota bacterium]
MHRFKYVSGELSCENVPVGDIARRFGTPFYLYSNGTILDHYKKIRDAFRKVDPIICFSMKANSNLAFLSSLVSRGAGLDIVSGGELFKALKVKCPPGRIVYASVGKRADEVKEAIARGILLFNVESRPELEMINGIAGGLGRKVNAALRLNPDVEAMTHRYITTGRSENKFGLDFKTAGSIFASAERYPNIDISGVHVHIGSQITKGEPFVKAVKKTLAFIDAMGLKLRYFNIGGGLGIVYRKESPQTSVEFAGRIVPLLRGRNFRLILEPGRFIAGPSGILVTQVIYVKETPSGKKFAIVDAGMNDLIRPSLYEAYHEILPVTRPGKRREFESYDVVGPICESGDFLAKARRMPVLDKGDLLAVMGAGAYGFTMSSNYNSRPRVCEIMVDRGKAYVVRERESYGDLIRGERIPGQILA